MKSLEFAEMERSLHIHSGSLFCRLWVLMAQQVKNLPARLETLVRSLGWKDPLEEMATHSSILAWNIPWTEEPVGYSPWGCKESDTAEWLSQQQQRQSWPHWVLVQNAPKSASSPVALALLVPALWGSLLPVFLCHIPSLTFKLFLKADL